MTASYINDNKGQDGSVENLSTLIIAMEKERLQLMVLLHQVALI